MFQTSRRFLILLGILLSLLLMNVQSVHAASTVKVWLQVMDSCKQALPGANFTLVNPDGSTVNAGPSTGTSRTTISSGTCPLQRGNCQTISTGCVTWTIAVPTSGTATYMIKERPTFDAADGFNENPAGATSFTGFVPCNGGSACRTQTATFTVNSSGVISGITTNGLPDGKTSQYPAGSMSAGTQTDPIVFHNFQLGNGSCDGDHDADDHLTGSPSSHCDSEND